MMGTDENPGFIPLAINSIFENIKSNTQREFLLRVSYMEIYNEVINDLLRSEGGNLAIREDPKKGIFIEGLKEEIVVSPEHVLHVINSGEARRHVASTDYNLMSSRSHTVFRLLIESNNIGDQDSKSIRVSALTLIDLAGSEKVVSNSSVRKREGAHINKSLLTLGTVISKLSERKKGEKIGHLPYRDSKLTRILEPTLGGNSRISLLCTITPASGNFEETHNTLKFATRAKKVTNKAKYGTDQEKALIGKYRQEIDELKQRLDEAEQREKILVEMNDKSETASNTSEFDSKLVEGLKQQLQDQENLRISYEEKIKQLTKLIIVSSSVPQAPPEKRNRSITGGLGFKLLRSRSKTQAPNNSLNRASINFPLQESEKNIDNAQSTRASDDSKISESKPSDETQIFNTYA